MPKINRDGVDIYYEIHGSGPPLLLTHGYSSTSEMWHGQIEALSKHHKLVLWDMRGHGRSDYPDDLFAYSEALTVADMAALLDQVGAKNAIVGGLSLGGYMSLAFYSRAPRPGVRAPDHRYRTGLQERRRLGSLEQARARDRRPLRARRPRRAEIRQPRTLRCTPSRRFGPGARRARHADPA